MSEFECETHDQHKAQCGCCAGWYCPDCTGGKNCQMRAIADELAAALVGAADTHPLDERCWCAPWLQQHEPNCRAASAALARYEAAKK